MNRRNFLKSFSAFVVAIPVLRNFACPTPTVTTKTIEQVKAVVEPLRDYIEIKIDRFNILRITRLQYRMREKAFKDKGYVCEGNYLVYDPYAYQKGYFDYDYSNI